MSPNTVLRPTALAAPRFVTAGFAPHLVPYTAGLALQQRAVDRLHRGVDRGTVYLLEHPPVYTAGRRSDAADYPRDGTEVVTVDRGGKVTWHGPGQLVAYPVIRLADSCGVVDFVRALEGALISVAAHFGVDGFRVDGRSGVWTQPATGRAAKLAQIGLHTSAGIVTHGLALNCSNDLSPFTNFVPCGITDADVTSLSRLAGTRITPADAAPILETHLSSALAECAA
ncbi:lipoyl(octanoyl) transferase LipB [Leucobacter sp. 7(1)]|uniref:lipoyl(octanoyl) transferase LipB n=1 Tax=Leucobacter sp. 7(1) TaxID=1255613 RepID=UPI000B35A04F|nr:lipoyl(octanoyl) transferase LipB [Leucobacter sp. 7(1)]